MPPKEWKDLHSPANTEAEFIEAIKYKGLSVIEVYAGWCGPCQCIVPTFKRLHWEMVEERKSGLQFIVVRPFSFNSASLSQAFLNQ